MESYIKDKINDCYSYLKNTIIPQNSSGPTITTNLSNENVKIVEKNKRIFYFSDFTLNIDEMLGIIERINLIKEFTFKTLLETMNYICKGKIFISI